MVERKYVLRSRRVLILLSYSQLVTGNTAEMREIVATLLKNSSSHSLRVAVMVQGLSSVSLDCQREYPGPIQHVKYPYMASRFKKKRNLLTLVTLSLQTEPTEAPKRLWRVDL
jgi:hypothetical protein